MASDENVRMNSSGNQQLSLTSFRSTTIDASIEAETNRRKQHFRCLVSDIAEHLDANDVDNIIWQKGLPQKMKDKSALAVLEWLYSHGEYSMDEVRPLAQLLKAIHREDITEKVESFQEKFGRHSSLPANSPKPHLFAEKNKASTLSGGQSASQIANIDEINEKSPHQESGEDCDDTDIHSAKSSRPQDSLQGTSLLSGPLETPVVEDEATLCSTRQQQFNEMMSPHQVHQSHDQIHQSHDQATRLGQKMPKQISFEQIEANHTAQTVMESRRIYRSCSSTTPVTVRTLEGQSMGNRLHSGNVSSELLHNNPIHEQPVWKFNSNPSSSNVSQENILASSSHSDVNVPVSSPRVLVQPHHHPHVCNHHLLTHSSSNPLSQELQAQSNHYQQSPANTCNSHHPMNHHVNTSPSFHVGNFHETNMSYTTQRSCPVHRTQSGHSLSQCSCCRYCVVQPCACQQSHGASNTGIFNGYHTSQEHVSPVVIGSNTHIQHHHSNSYTNYSGTDSRCTSRASMRQPSTAGMVTQPPQLFPTAYPSTQNIAAQQQFLSSSLYTPPRRHSRQPPTVTRHLSLATPQDHTQQGHTAPQRYSGYTTDGSGPDDVFQSYPEDHLLSTAPERSNTHPQAGPSAKSTRQHRARISQDPLSDHNTESTLSSNRGTVPAGHSGMKGSEVSMEMPFMGGLAAGASEKGGSMTKHAWDVATSHSGDLNDTDSGFIGSAPHGINGETRRSFTPSTSAKLQTELKKLMPLSQPSMMSNSVSGGFSHMPGGVESIQKKSKPKKKRPSSHSFEQENGVHDHEDPPSDDNIPVVYKDDDECWKSSTVRRSKDRAITRGAIQYRSLRYERDRQIQRRGKPNRSSLQSFDGNTLDSLQLEKASRTKHSSKSPGSVNGHGSAYSLKSRSSQDTLTTTQAVSMPHQGRNLQPSSVQSSHHHYHITKEDNGTPSASSNKHTKPSGVSAKSCKSTTPHSQPSKAPLDSNSPDSIPHSARGTTASYQPKKSWFASKLHRRSKPQAKLIRPNELVWPIKRDKLNKYIYESKYAKKPLQCKHKLELESETGIGSCPKLKFELHPYGLEEDENEYVTIKVHVEQPKHCDLHSSTVIQITLNIFDCESGDPIRQPYVKYESIRSSYFLIKEFVHHDLIKKSRCDFVEVTIQACLVVSEASEL